MEPIAPSCSHQQTLLFVKRLNTPQLKLIPAHQMHLQICKGNSSWAKDDRTSAKSHVFKVNSFVITSISEWDFSPVCRVGFEVCFGKSLISQLTISSSLSPSTLHLQWIHLWCPAMDSTVGFFGSFSLFAFLQCLYIVQYFYCTLCTWLQSIILALSVHAMCPPYTCFFSHKILSYLASASDKSPICRRQILGF